MLSRRILLGSAIAALLPSVAAVAQALLARQKIAALLIEPGSFQTIVQGLREHGVVSGVLACRLIKSPAELDEPV